jgi:hypothetical protein
MRDPSTPKKEPPPVPIKTYSLKERGIEPDDQKIRNYENSNRSVPDFIINRKYTITRTRAGPWEISYLTEYWEL